MPSRAERRHPLRVIEGKVIPIKKEKVDFPERVVASLAALEQQKVQAMGVFGEKQMLIIRAFVEAKGFNSVDSNIDVAKDFKYCLVSDSAPPKGGKSGQDGDVPPSEDTGLAKGKEAKRSRKG